MFFFSSFGLFLWMIFFSGYHKAARTEQYTFLFMPLVLCVLFSSSLSLSLSQKRDQRLICITCVYFQIDKFYLITTIERFTSHTPVAHTDILYIDFYLIFSFFIKYLYRCFLCVNGWLRCCFYQHLTTMVTSTSQNQQHHQLCSWLKCANGCFSCLPIFECILLYHNI